MAHGHNKRQGVGNAWRREWFWARTRTRLLPSGSNLKWQLRRAVCDSSVRYGHFGTPEDRHAGFLLQCPCCTFTALSVRCSTAIPLPYPGLCCPFARPCPLPLHLPLFRLCAHTLFHRPRLISSLSSFPPGALWHHLHQRPRTRPLDVQTRSEYILLHRLATAPWTLANADHDAIHTPPRSSAFCPDIRTTIVCLGQHPLTVAGASLENGKCNTLRSGSRRDRQRSAAA